MEQVRYIMNTNFLSTDLLHSKDDYPIQLGAFRLRSNAELLYNKIKSTDIDAKIIFEDGIYKVRIARIPPDKETGTLTREKNLKSLKTGISRND